MRIPSRIEEQMSWLGVGDDSDPAVGDLIREGKAKRHRLEENLGALRIQLTSDDLRYIDRAASQIEVHGAGYPEHLQKMVGR